MLEGNVDAVSGRKLFLHKLSRYIQYLKKRILRKRIVDLSSYIPVVFIMMYNEVSYQVVLIRELGALFGFMRGFRHPTHYHCVVCCHI